MLKETWAVIGTCPIFFNKEENNWDISYNLGKIYWGKGYTLEAMQRVMAYAAEVLEIEECIAVHAVENPASGRVMQGLGKAAAWTAEPAFRETLPDSVAIHVYLQNRGFPVPKVIFTVDKKPYFVHTEKKENCYYILYEYNEGQNSDPETDTEAAGALIGQLH